MSKKSSESSENMCKGEAKLLLTEKENVTIFMNTLPPTYYNRLIGHAGTLFANLVHTGERIKDDLKTAKLKDYQTLLSRCNR